MAVPGGSPTGPRAVLVGAFDVVPNPPKPVDVPVLLVVLPLPKSPLPVVPVFDAPKVGLFAVVLLPKIDEPPPPPKGVDVDALFPEPNPPKPPEVEAVVEAPNNPPPVDVLPKAGLEPNAPPVLLEDPNPPPVKTRLVYYSRVMLKRR